MFWFKSNKRPQSKPEPEKPETRPIYKTDDLLTRAKNIVWAIGYRGAVGDFVLRVHEVLSKYETADAMVAPPTEESPEP